MTRRLTGRLLFAVAAAAVSAVVYAALGSAASTALSKGTPPTISGNPVVGSTLSAGGDSWSGGTVVSKTYTWYRCDSGGTCATVIGTTSSPTYVVQTADVGSRISVIVNASDGTTTTSSDAATPTATVAAQATTAPANTKAPELTGTLKEGDTLTLNPGTWTGTTPITFSYEWQRCNAQGVNCSNFAVNSTATYKLVAADVGNRIQVRVTAKNSAGDATRYSNQTAQIGSSAAGPANTAAPALSGTFTQGQTLHVSSGTWTGTSPITISYQWQRCNAQGQNCAPIGGATGQAYTLTSADTGNRVQVLVTARNPGGDSSKYSNQSPTIAGSGGTTAAAGTIAAASVALPNRLVIDRVQFPQGGHARVPFQARFHVADTSHHSVSGALVYLIGLPYGWVRPAPEQATDATGWVTITLNPMAKMPLKTSLVMFVRARTPQGDLLAGASTRRLVQVRIRG